jgi:ParB family chromosome partitioning protein
MKIPIDKIKPDKLQPRKIFDEAYITGLSTNLQVEGMINPIEVDPNFVIITGECRWRAAKLAGWEEVSVSVNKKPFSEYERLRRQMAENLHQSSAGSSSPMNAIDVAKGYKRLIKLHIGKDYKAGLTSREEIYGLIKGIPEELGVTYQTMHDYLKLLEEPAYIVEDITKGRPRTYYKEANYAPDEWKEKLKSAISKGQVATRKDVKRFVRLAKTKPEKAEIEFLRITQKQNENANRILNRAVELGLVLKNSDPTKFTLQDRKMIFSQLGSVSGSIRGYLGKLKT